MHLTFNLECNKVRQDISVKQEKILDKKQIDYSAKNQYISPKIKAKKRVSTGQFFFSFVQFLYKVIKSIVNRQQ